MAQKRKIFTFKAVGISRRFFILAGGSTVFTTFFAGCGTSETSSTSSPAASAPAGSSASAPTSQSAVLKVGVSPVPHAEVLKFVKDNLASAQGLNLEIIEFSDYVQPNLALGDKQLDANYFQHIPYMEDFAQQHNLDLVSIAAVHIEPLGLYSKRIQSLSELKDGATVSIPNDVTNLGRSLKLLQDNQLLTLKSSAGITATKADIEQNPKNLEFAELEAAQLPRSLDDVDLAVINGNYAIQVNLTPSKDALGLETAQNNPYANVLATSRDRENDPNIQALGELLTSPEVKKFIEDKYQGSVIPAF